MSNRVKIRKLLLCFAICGTILNGSSPGADPSAAPPPGGIGAASDAAAAKALDLLNNGKLTEAAQAYTDLIQNPLYRTAGVVPEALFRLGYIEYMQGEYDQAVTTLNRIVSPPATAAVKMAADALAPQIIAARAAKLSPGSTERKAAFENVIKAFDDFIQKYPNSPEVESATYGKAVAAFQNQDFDGAEKYLKSNLQRFQNSDTILSSEDLLAVVLTAEGNAILGQHGDQGAAFGKFKEALGYLANIIQRRSDVALGNDAQFQIGEVLYDQANAEKDPDKTKDLGHAIDAYRAVRPTSALIAEQQQRVALVLARLQQVSASNPGAVGDIQRVQDRENAKLEALKRAPDQMMNAQLRIASGYFLLQKYDEARVLLRYLQAFAEEAEQKKQIAYYMVLTYASQGIMDKAEEAYNAFQSAYRGDPIGENLPVVMGQAYMSGTNNQPDKAAAYLQQESVLYPNSTLANEALNTQAEALEGQHKYDEAIAAYNKFLGMNPPAEQAAEAQRGIAAIYQQTGKTADAVAQYQKVADTYPGTPMAEECAFYAAGLETTVDMKGALPKLQAFVAKYPDGKFTAQATMMIGQAQAAQGDADGAIATYKSVITKFPATDFAPQAYFQVAAIQASQKKTDDMVATLKEFTGKYPDNKNIFYAYDTIGQTQVSKGKVADAIATYAEMADKHADNPMAPTALYRTAELWRKQADTLGKYIALSEAQRADWKTAVTGSIAAAEKLLGQFPDSDQVGVTLKTLLSDQEMLLDAQLEKPEDIDKYFRGLGSKFGSNPSARSRIMFTLATFTYKKDPVTGLAQMGTFFNPSVVYAPGDLDLYGSALLDQGKAGQAYKLYEKISNDYPIPSGVRPAQATVAIQEAQAMALFGMGSALEAEGKTEDAGKLFAELKANYPWSPKVVEANFGIAKSMVAQNNLDDAGKLLVGIVSSRTASASVRAHAMLLIGDIQNAKGNMDTAIDSYMKAATFYGGIEDAASEALWKAGQLFEKQAATLTEQTTPKKSEQMAKGIAAYKQIVTQYAGTKYVSQAQDRLNALGSP